MSTPEDTDPQTTEDSEKESQVIPGLPVEISIRVKCGGFDRSFSCSRKLQSAYMNMIIFALPISEHIYAEWPHRFPPSKKHPCYHSCMQ